MHFTKKDLQNLEHLERLNLINSVTGIKPANLIGSISNGQNPNLAIFSSIVHLGSNPALIGFILRPKHEVRRHTYENIMENGCYTINHIHQSFIEQAHYTSAKFEAEESEFEKCHLTEEYLPNFKAPFVKESNVKLGMKFLEALPIKLNNTVMIIGEIQHLIVEDTAFETKGHLNLTTLNSIGISGLNSYYTLQKVAQFPYARPTELPNFQ